MAIPAAAKVAITVLTDKRLLKIAGGIILGVIIIIIAPIAILLGVMDTGQSIDRNSPEMQQQVIANMTDEEKSDYSISQTLCRPLKMKSPRGGSR